MSKTTQRKHAILSASSAERWLNCTPSARLNEKMPDTTSPYAAEGTLAHSIAELMLQRELKLITKRKFETQLAKYQEHELYYKGMEDDCDPYISYALEAYHAARTKTPDAVIYLEERLDYSEYVPEGFGTGDCIIIADGQMEIIDLKFGKGVEVSPVDNPQLKLYALGAYLKYSFIFDISWIVCTVAQVRLDNISSWSIAAEALEDWAETIRPIAAKADKGEGDLVPGPWCTFCKVRQTCRTRAEANMDVFEKNRQDPRLMGSDEIAVLLGRIDEIAKWAKELGDYALEAALAGTSFPGWKVVEGRSNRKISDETKLADILLAEGYKDQEIYKPKALETLTALEKLIGKKDFAALAADCIEKPPGKPTLAPEDDNRPAIGSVEDEFF